jgi:hypothetical protein
LWFASAAGTVGCAVIPETAGKKAWYMCPAYAYTLYAVTPILAQAIVDDDFIGITEAVPGGCFIRENGAVPFNLLNYAGQRSGWIYLDDTFSSRELCPLEADIGGDPIVCIGGFPLGNLNPIVNTPEGPFTYKWYEDGALVGTGWQYQIQNQTPGVRSIELEVTRLSDGDVDSVQKSIPVETTVFPAVTCQ